MTNKTHRYLMVTAITTALLVLGSCLGITVKNNGSNAGTINDGNTSIGDITTGDINIATKTKGAK